MLQLAAGKLRAEIARLEQQAVVLEAELARRDSYDRALRRLHAASSMRATPRTTAEVLSIALEQGASVIAASTWAVFQAPLVDLPDEARSLTDRAIAEAEPIGFAREPSPGDDGVFAGAEAVAAVPMMIGPEVLGVLAFGFPEPHLLDESECMFLDALGSQCAQAIERARLLVEAHEAGRRKDEFLAMLGHELRNPLAPIVTALEVMRLRGGGHERERDVIDRQVRHLERLVDDLLDVSRITRGKVSLSREPLELAAAVASAVEIASPLLEQRAHILTIQVARTGLLIDADPVRIAQVISNLLTNAARYTEPGGRIGIVGRRDGDEIVLVVEDDGRGIPAEILPRVFELFVQDERPLDRAQGGLGLGLALARSLVELHDGTIAAASAGPGQGSQFTVRLPALAVKVPTDELPVVAPIPRPATGRMHVLVVDDNIDSADLVCDALRRAGHTATVAYDGPSALTAAAARLPDAAFVDIGLPVMDGYEVAVRLRKLAGAHPLHLVAVTGYGQDSDKLQSRNAGFGEHMVKPVSLAALLASLERATVVPPAAIPLELPRSA